MSEKRVIITGATGMVGGCALRLCLENPDVSQVTVIGRSPTGINDAILREVVVDAFADYSGLEDTLKNQDTALYCLGAYTGAVPDDLFRQITVDYTLAFARSLHRASPAGHLLLSQRPGGRSDRKEPYGVCALQRGGRNRPAGYWVSPCAHLPARIHLPRHPAQGTQPRLHHQPVLMPMLRRLYPNIGIPSEDLARAMVHAGIYGTGGIENPILENKDIRFMEGL